MNFTDANAEVPDLQAAADRLAAFARTRGFSSSAKVLTAEQNAGQAVAVVRFQNGAVGGENFFALPTMEGGVLASMTSVMDKGLQLD